GGLTIVRDPQSGRVDTTTAGLVSDSFGYSPYGELSSHSASLNGPTLLAWTYNRDNLGRITTVVETDGATSLQHDYEYDPQPTATFYSSERTADLDSRDRRPWRL